jgi:hypothetical protein
MGLADMKRTPLFTDHPSGFPRGAGEAGGTRNGDNGGERPMGDHYIDEHGKLIDRSTGLHPRFGDVIGGEMVYPPDVRRRAGVQPGDGPAIANAKLREALSAGVITRTEMECSAERDEDFASSPWAGRMMDPTPAFVLASIGITDEMSAAERDRRLRLALARVELDLWDVRCLREHGLMPAGYDAEPDADGPRSAKADV